VKAQKIGLNLEEILRRVRERGEWRINELEKAALKISERLGDWFTTESPAFQGGDGVEMLINSLSFICSMVMS